MPVDHARPRREGRARARVPCRKRWACAGSLGSFWYSGLVWLRLGGRLRRVGAVTSGRVCRRPAEVRGWRSLSSGGVTCLRVT